MVESLAKIAAVVAKHTWRAFELENRLMALGEQLTDKEKVEKVADEEGILENLHDEREKRMLQGLVIAYRIARSNKCELITQVQFESHSNNTWTTFSSASIPETSFTASRKTPFGELLSDFVSHISTLETDEMGIWRMILNGRCMRYGGNANAPDYEGLIEVYQAALKVIVEECGLTANVNVFTDGSHENAIDEHGAINIEIDDPKKEHFQDIADGLKFGNVDISEVAQRLLGLLEGGNERHIVLVGITGSGKSTTGNGIASSLEGEDVHFFEEGSAGSKTDRVSYYKVGKFVIWDTPGLDDTSGRDDIFISMIRRLISTIGHVSTIVMCEKDPERARNTTQAFYRKYRELFGKSMEGVMVVSWNTEREPSKETKETFIKTMGLKSGLRIQPGRTVWSGGWKGCLPFWRMRDHEKLVTILRNDGENTPCPVSYMAKLKDAVELLKGASGSTLSGNFVEDIIAESKGRLRRELVRLVGENATVKISSFFSRNAIVLSAGKNHLDSSDGKPKKIEARLLIDDLRKRSPESKKMRTLSQGKVDKVTNYVAACGAVLVEPADGEYPFVQEDGMKVFYMKLITIRGAVRNQLGKLIEDALNEQQRPRS